MVPSNGPGDDDEMYPSTVTRLYQPTPYNSTYRTSTLNMSQCVPPAGTADFDAYSSPHYAYHVATNYSTTAYCRQHAVDLCSSCAMVPETDSDRANPTSGLSTIVTSSVGDEINGQFYASTGSALFPVCVSTGTGSCMTSELNCVDSCLTCRSDNQLMSH